MVVKAELDCRFVVLNSVKNHNKMNYFAANY